MADGKGRGKVSGADKSGADWITKLGESLQTSEPPEGYKTISELAEKFKSAPTTVRGKLQRLVAKGQLDVVSVRVLQDGKSRVQKYYGPKGS